MKAVSQVSFIRRFAIAVIVVLPVCFASAQEYATNSGFITDDKVYQTITAGSKRLLREYKITPLEVINENLGKTCVALTIPKILRKVKGMPSLYHSCRESVLVVATLYKCDHCPEDHIRAASGFVIAGGGVAVTNYHVFAGNGSTNRDYTQVVMDHFGNVYAVTEILAASKSDDIAIFRFDTGGKVLTPMPLAESVSTGEDAIVIGHPHSMFYSMTTGAVSRLYVREGGEKMSITADFAQGSSGGPVLDRRGNVIGVVAATLSLYNSDNNLQMVSKEAIPVSRIRALITHKK
jgi:serine protease Do